MSRMPGFTAEQALFERTQRHYGAGGVGRSSGSVKPAFNGVGRLNPHWLEFSWTGLRSRICCLLTNCPKGEVCISDPGGGCFCFNPRG